MILEIDKRMSAYAIAGVSFSFAIFAGRMYRLFDEMYLDVNGYLMSLQSVEWLCQHVPVCDYKRSLGDDQSEWSGTDEHSRGKRE